MTTKRSHSFNDRIALLERRLDRRRERFAEDKAEAFDAAKQAATYALPVAAAVGAGLAAVWFTRRRWPAYRRLAARRAAPTEETVRRGVRWGSIAGIVGTAIRIGTSPQARALYESLRRRRRASY